MWREREQFEIGLEIQFFSIFFNFSNTSTKFCGRNYDFIARTTTKMPSKCLLIACTDLQFSGFVIAELIILVKRQA